jgi:uncharacterized protein (TIGR02996 family)
MDLLSQHEAFLRVIFDTPEDDTARLVYADFLQEQGEEDRASFIRIECEFWRCPLDDPRRDSLYIALHRLRRQFPATHAWPWVNTTERGFPKPATAMISPEDLADPKKLRWNIVQLTPEFFGATTIRVVAPPRLSPEMFDPLFGLVAFTQMTNLDLRGSEFAEGDSSDLMLQPFRIEPVITSAGVVALANHRGVRRLTTLILTNNDLDNDAARALVASPYLDNLKQLRLLEGNRFRGKVWQQVIERFGEDVVG